MKREQKIRHILGSEAILTLVLPKNIDADFVFDSLWLQIDRFEGSFSRFLSESELSNFNRQAGQTVAISIEFMRLLKISKEMSQKTNGLFNPFILPALQRAGYAGSWPKPEKINRSIDFHNKQCQVKLEDLIIRGNTAKIPKNSALDLGGIGKGYLLDQLSLFIEKKNIHRYWFSLGGDIICNGLDIDEQPWLISIDDAIFPKKSIEQISNSGKKLAVATSGIVKRQGEYMGKMWHHLIDPETGRPAITDALTATVCADKATLADVAAKCLVIGDSFKSKKLFNRLPISFALLQLCPEGSNPIIKDGSRCRIIKYLKKEN